LSSFESIKGWHLTSIFCRYIPGQRNPHRKKINFFPFKKINLKFISYIVFCNRFLRFLLRRII
jgi:hypothetical protein